MFFRKFFLSFVYLATLHSLSHCMQNDNKLSFEKQLPLFESEAVFDRFKIPLEYKEFAGHFGVVLRSAQEFLNELAVQDNELSNEPLFVQYQNDFISYIEKEINKGKQGVFYGSTNDLFNLARSCYWPIYKKIVSPSAKKLLINQKIFDQKLLPLLIMAETNPSFSLQAKCYGGSLLFALGFNPCTINKLVYQYKAFSRLYNINTKNSRNFENIKIKIGNVFVSQGNKKTLKVRSVFKDFIEGSKVIGAYMLDGNVHVKLAHDNNKITQTAESNINYFKECFRPTSYLNQHSLGEYFQEMTKDMQKRFITFLLCNKQQGWRKMPKVLVNSYIFDAVYTYDMAQRMKLLFLEDIQRCKNLKEIPDDTYSQSLINFLYNDFEQWYEQKINR